MRDHDNTLRVVDSLVRRAQFINTVQKKRKKVPKLVTIGLLIYRKSAPLVARFMFAYLRTPVNDGPSISYIKP